MGTITGGRANVNFGKCQYRGDCDQHDQSPAANPAYKWIIF